MKEYWSKGGKRKQILWGKEEFRSEFWPERSWKWSKVENPRHGGNDEELEEGLKKTDVLRQMVRNIFQGVYFCPYFMNNLHQSVP